MTTQKTVEVGVGGDRTVAGGMGGLHKIRGLAPLCQLCQETLKTSHPPVQTMTPPPPPGREGGVHSMARHRFAQIFIIFTELDFVFCNREISKNIKNELTFKNFLYLFPPCIGTFN